MGAIVQVAENIITNAIKHLQSFLTLNHIDSEVGHLKYSMQLCQSARSLFIHFLMLLAMHHLSYAGANTDNRFMH